MLYNLTPNIYNLFLLFCFVYLDNSRQLLQLSRRDRQPEGQVQLLRRAPARSTVDSLRRTVGRGQRRQRRRRKKTESHPTTDWTLLIRTEIDENLKVIQQIDWTLLTRIKIAEILKVILQTDWTILTRVKIAEILKVILQLNSPFSIMKHWIRNPEIRYVAKRTLFKQNFVC